MLRLILPSLLLVAPSAIFAACGSSDEALGAFDSDGTGNVILVGGSGGNGGGDASIDVAPTGGTPNPATYAEHCGIDACVPGGDGADCARGGTGMDADTPDGEQVFHCQIASVDGEAMASCVEDVGESTDPCQASSDCAPGLGCVVVGDPAAMNGRCMPYCCGDWEVCPEASFCALEHLRDDVRVEIPVCTPIVPCQLLADELCPADQTCTIVRKDGTTSCVDIAGSGTLCDPCPCGPGFICSQGSQTCQKLCHTDSTGECGDGVCVGSAENFPPGFGVCASGENDCF